MSSVELGCSGDNEVLSMLFGAKNNLSETDKAASKEAAAIWNWLNSRERPLYGQDINGVEVEWKNEFNVHTVRFVLPERINPKYKIVVYCEYDGDDDIAKCYIKALAIGYEAR